MTILSGRALNVGGFSPGTVRVHFIILLLAFFAISATSVAGQGNDNQGSVKIHGFENVTGLAGSQIPLSGTFENKDAKQVELDIAVVTGMPGEVVAPEKVVLEGKAVQNVTIWLIPLNGTEGTFDVTVEASWVKNHHSNTTLSVTITREPDIGSGNGGGEGGEVTGGDGGGGGASSPLALPAAEPVTVTAGVGAGLLFGVLAVAIGTEWGKLAFLNLFIAIPLFTRLRRDHLMDHVHRAKLLKFIEASPGAHFSEIKRKLDLHNGVLAYHIKALEREGVILSKMDGQYRRFYPVTMSVPKKEIEDLTWHQLAILDVIRKRPGIRQKEIAEQMGESKQVINYHLRGLVEMGIVLKEEEGRESYYTADEKKIFDLSKK